MRKSVAVLILWSELSHAGIFKCVDATGNTTFSDRPCPGQQQEQIDKGTNATSAEPSTSAEGLGESFCSTSISNGKEWLESMRDAGKKNLASGHMTKEQYDKGLPELNRLETKLTQAECSAATGNQRKFFECLNKVTNHIAKCLDTYRPY